MDRGAWWATVHGATKSRTLLCDRHFHFQAPVGTRKSARDENLENQQDRASFLTECKEMPDHSCRFFGSFFL